MQGVIKLPYNSAGFDLTCDYHSLYPLEGLILGGLPVNSATFDSFDGKYGFCALLVDNFEGGVSLCVVGLLVFPSVSVGFDFSL